MTSHKPPETAVSSTTATLPQPGSAPAIGFQQLNGQSAPIATTQWQPAVEIRETADCIYIQVQLPGFEREDIEVQAFETEIAVRGAQFPYQPASPSDILMSEFCYGAFERVLQLPGAIAVDQVQAELSCGLLTISLVKIAAG